MTIRLKRIYEPASPHDGRRVLVDRLWPRGVSKAKAAISYWAKDVAPSDTLRQWYRHAPDKWEAFQERYARELDANPEGITALRKAMGRGRVTFLFSSREERLNNAAALRRYLLERASRREVSSE